MTNRLLFSFVFVVISTSCAAAQITADDAVDLLEQYPAVRLDSLLPKTAFLTWFKNLVGASAKTIWEVNDCGEQAGVPIVDQSREIPVCFEITAVYPDQRKVGIAIAVGTERKGLSGDPTVYNIYIEDASGKVFNIKRLRDLVRALGPAQGK